MTTSYRYKAIRVVKTHTRPGGASCYGRGRGSRTHIAMVTTWGRCCDHVEEFLSSGVMYSWFLYYCLSPSTETHLRHFPFFPSTAVGPQLHLDCADAEKRSPVVFFRSKEVGGGQVCVLLALCCVMLCFFFVLFFCQHLSWSISEHSVSMSESYSEWPVGSLTGDGGSCGVWVRELCVSSWNESVREYRPRSGSLQAESLPSVVSL